MSCAGTMYVIREATGISMEASSVGHKYCDRLRLDIERVVIKYHTIKYLHPRIKKTIFKSLIADIREIPLFRESEMTLMFNRFSNKNLI